VTRIKTSRNLFDGDHLNKRITVGELLTDFCMYLLIQEDEPHKPEVLRFFTSNTTTHSYYNYLIVLKDFIDLAYFVDNVSVLDEEIPRNVIFLKSLISDDEILGLMDYLIFEFNFGYPDDDGFIGTTNMCLSINSIESNFEQYIALFEDIKVVEGFTYYLQYVNFVADKNSHHIKSFVNGLAKKQAIIEHSKDSLNYTSLEITRTKLVSDSLRSQSENIYQFEMEVLNNTVELVLPQSALALCKLHSLLNIPIDNIESHLRMFYLSYFEKYFNQYLVHIDPKSSGKINLSQWQIVANYIASIDLQWIEDEIHSSISYYLIEGKKFSTHRSAADELYQSGLTNLEVGKIENILSETFKSKNKSTSNSIFHNSHIYKLNKMKESFNTSLNPWFWDQLALET
jgi:hypothetical protein